MKTFIPSTKETIVNLDNYRTIEPFSYKNERNEIHIFFPDSNFAIMLHYKTIQERNEDFERLIKLVS